MKQFLLPLATTSTHPDIMVSLGARRSDNRAKYPPISASCLPTYTPASRSQANDNKNGSARRCRTERQQQLHPRHMCCRYESFKKACRQECDLWQAPHHTPYLVVQVKSNGEVPHGRIRLPELLAHLAAADCVQMQRRQVRIKSRRKVEKRVLGLERARRVGLRPNHPFESPSRRKISAARVL